MDVTPPARNLDDAFFWAATREHQLVARQCLQCRYLQHPPAPMCPSCGSLEFTAEKLTGKGMIHSWIRSTDSASPDEAGRLVALIDLDEGIRIVSNIVGAELSDLRSGGHVEVDFEDYDEFTLPVFRLCVEETV